MNDLEGIEAMLENPLVMVSAIPLDEDSQATSGGQSSSVLHKNKTPQVK